jgi:hypothetical protein
MHHRETLERLVAKAMHAGRCKRIGVSIYEVDYSLNCENPIHREMFSCYDRERTMAREVYGHRGPLTVILICQCRKCDNCRLRHQMHWRYRCEAELKRSARTWFGTLTFHPSISHGALSQCRLDSLKKGFVYDEAPASEQFQLFHNKLQKYVTLFFKKLRKTSQSPVRYVLVAEAHKTGIPHYHMLLHEVSVSKPIRKLLLHATWDVGFSSWKLVDTEDGHAKYVTKYLNKGANARVRASVKYGQS